MRYGEKQLEIATERGEEERPKAGRNDLPRSYITKETKLWRSQELDTHTRLRRTTKMVFLHKFKIVFY